MWIFMDFWEKTIFKYGFNHQKGSFYGNKTKRIELDEGFSVFFRHVTDYLKGMWNVFLIHV